MSGGNTAADLRGVLGKPLENPKERRAALYGTRVKEE
jgi:hypothetical protein